MPPTRVLRLPTLLVAVVAAIVTVVLAPSPALACKCRPASVAVHAKRADAVFTGTVTRSRRSTEGTTKKPREIRTYTVAVERTYQGKLSGTTLTVATAATPAACGIGPLTKGDTWVFFVTGKGTTFAGTSCGGSAPASAAYVHKVEKVLGAGTAVVEPRPPTPPLSFDDVETASVQPLARMVAPGAALALLGLLGLLLVGRRSRVRA
ncbi:MAG: hypothetical protein R2731_00210 [Nocardioides sp.]